MIRIDKSTCTVCCLLILLAWMLCGIVAAKAESVETCGNNWEVLGGYGQSVPGWGLTTQRVESLDFIPRYNLCILDNPGSGPLRGFHSIFFELPVSVVFNPDSTAMLGLNFLQAYTFTFSQKYRPYIFGGGGPVYIFSDIPGMGARLNGNYQFGLGLRYDWRQDHKILIETRYHHISNAGTEDPNDPLNSFKILFGITF